MRLAGFLPSPVRTGFGPSRLRSLTWIRCWNLPFLLLPVPRLVGSAASRCRSRRSTASHRLQPDRPSLRCTVEPASQDCSTRVVSVVALDARNLLVQEDRIDCGALGRSMLSGWIVDIERARRDLARLIRRCERRRAMAISRLRGKAIPSSAASTALTVPPRICGPAVSAACCRAGTAGWAFDASAPAPVMIPSRCARSTRAWLRPPWSRRRPRGVGSGEDAASGAHPLCALPVPAVGVSRRRRRPRWPAECRDSLQPPGGVRLRIASIDAITAGRSGGCAPPAVDASLFLSFARTCALARRIVRSDASDLLSQLPVRRRPSAKVLASASIRRIPDSSRPQDVVVAGGIVRPTACACAHRRQGASLRSAPASRG